MHETQTAGNRIAEQTPTEANRKIARATEESVIYFASHPDDIDARLSALENEWDIERTLITNASSLMLLGLLLGFFVKRQWLLLPFVIATFLFQHGVQGWCPPLPLFRWLGIRTKEEILRERYALRALRGDLDPICTEHAGAPQQHARRVLAAVNE
jgi:hypothetical protein